MRYPVEYDHAVDYTTIGRMSYAERGFIALFAWGLVTSLALFTVLIVVLHK